MTKYLLFLFFLFTAIASGQTQRTIENPPQDLSVCDSDNDGFASFDLTVNTPVVIGSQNPSDVLVSYFETQLDAEQNSLQIASPSAYMNIIANIQTIYVRVDNLVTGMFDIDSFVIVVNVTLAASPNDLSECDDNGDDIEVFDLTQNDSVVTGSQNPSVIIVSYHLSQADLDNGMAIQTPTAFSNTASPQTIFMLVENVVTNCSAEATFDIEVTVCNVDIDGDGVTNEDEDINGNGNLDDDDTDGDTIPDYLDNDDDGDLVLTQDEITGIGAGLAPIDTDNDGIQNYLDDDDDGDLILTKDEDYNNNGTPLDDDINANGIPDFLDEEAALSLNEINAMTFKMYPNPTHGHITIETATAFAKVKIYTLTGQLQLSLQRDPNSQWQIPLDALAAGIYFVHIEGRPIQKLVVW
ncbi:MAG: T9SS type A sorting domain-containing protein [Dokdonia sp.]|jgi:hypothetical protein